MLGAFTDQAYNLILLAEDEARMLGHPAVEPEHLLLAFARHGNVERLLREQGITASDLHAAILRAGGLGDELVLGRVSRSRATDEVLEGAVDAAAARGVRGPSSEHVLLALGQDERAIAVLQEVGITDVDRLVDAKYPRRAALSSEQVKRHLLRVAMNASPPQPGPIAPVFERYTAEAQRAVRAASEAAALLEHRYVQPLHLLLGCLHVPDSLAATVLEDELAPSDMGTLGEAMERARMYGPNPAHQATGIFTEAARHIVAEQALTYAYRHDHPSIGTGHLLLATLDAEDRPIDRIVGSGVMGSGPVHDRLARALTRALPGDEHPTGRVLDRGVICFDVLIRILTSEFMRIAPPGWKLHGSARSGGVRLQVPDSRSEEDYRIDLGWIVAHDGSGRDRLLDVTRKALQDLQTAITEHTGQPWPTDAAPGHPDHPEAHAEIIGDDINPRLRLWYGPHDGVTLEVMWPPILLNSVIQGFP